MGAQEGGNMSRSPKMRDINAAVQEGHSHLPNVYLDKSPKGRNDCMLHSGTIAIFCNFDPPGARGQKSRGINPGGLIPLHLYQQNGSLKYLNKYSPVWDTVRGFLPHPPPGGRG